MADNKEIQTPGSVLKNNLITLAEPENFQKYILGTKKNGAPRAAYDVFKDYVEPKKKKKKGKKKKKHKVTSYSFYLDNKPKKKKKKKKDHWHI